MLKKVRIYTDGSCLGNPGPGGWAAVLQLVDEQGEIRAEREVVGYEPESTNNRAELYAAISGLAALKTRCQVDLCLDSQYVAGILSGHKAKANAELVARLRELAAQHEVRVVKVAGHSGHALNERADRLARDQAGEVARLLRQGAMRLIVAGSRTFRDYALLEDTLDGLLARRREVVIVSGTAQGADQLGERYAAERKLPLFRMPAEWELYGKRAGYVRNEAMARVATHVVAFWDGASPGTRHMIELAERQELVVRVVRTDQVPEVA